MKGPIMLTGGTGKVFAAIGAVYPEGSTCTCSNKFNAKFAKGKTGTEDGVLAESETYITSAGFIPVVPNVKYTVNAPSVNPGDTAEEHGVVFFKSDESFLSYSSFGNDTYVYFTAPAEAAYMKLNFYVKTQPATMYEDVTILCGEKEKVLKAKNTSGAWIFTVPFIGTWTITATNGTATKSQSVSITKESQFESVELSYRYYVFAEGLGLSSDFTIKEKGSSVTFNTASIKCTSDSKGFVLEPTIPGGKYKTLCFEIEVTSINSNEIYHPALGLSDSTKLETSIKNNAFVAHTAVAAKTDRAVFSVDVSSVTVDARLKMSGYYARWEMFNIWFE